MTRIPLGYWMRLTPEQRGSIPVDSFYIDIGDLSARLDEPDYCQHMHDTHLEEMQMTEADYRAWQNPPQGSTHRG